MVILQGDVIWAELPPPVGSAPGYPRPALVISSDAFNRSTLATIIIAVITSNLSHQYLSGNVRLAKGEANLQRPSVVCATQILTIDRSLVRKKLGSLNQSRMDEIFDGLAIAFARTKPSS